VEPDGALSAPGESNGALTMATLLPDQLPGYIVKPFERDLLRLDSGGSSGDGYHLLA